MQYHNIHLVIHYDPVITDDPELQRLKTVIQKLLEEIDKRITLHDFRMLTLENQVRIFFDAALPADLMEQKQAIHRQLNAALAEAEPQISQMFITFDLAM